MKTLVSCLLGILLLGCGSLAQDLPPQTATPQEADPEQTPLTETSDALNCDLAGPWMLELKIPVRWEATLHVKAGSGLVRLRATSQRKAAGNLLIDGLTPCAFALPATELASGAQVRTDFAPQVFAQGTHVTTPALTSIRAPAPGARFRMQPFALQYGAVIANPTMATWPDDIEGNAVDVDADGHPGVSVPVTVGFTDAASAEDAWQRDPIANLYVAWRVVVRTAGGKIVSCERFQGLGVVPSLDQRLAVNVSVMGCDRRSGAACSAADVAKAATWLPHYLKDGNAAVRVKRAEQDAPGVCAGF